MLKKSLLLAVLPLSLIAAESTMTGWITDSECNSSNAGGSKEQRDCAKRCIESGLAAVFVSDSNQKVYKLEGAPQAKEHIKTKVRITGSITGDTLKVVKLEDVAE
jgi:hypothetical protein